MTWIKPLIQYLVYPLVTKLGEFIYKKYIMNEITKDKEKLQKEKDAIYKAIKKAETNEDRKMLSITLARLNRL